MSEFDKNALGLLILLAVGLGILLVATSPLWGHRLRLPFIIRSRVNDEYRKLGHEARAAADKQLIANKLEIIGQNAEVQESQRRHLLSLERTIEDGRAHNKKLLESLNGERDAHALVRAAWQASLAHNEAERVGHMRDMGDNDAHYEEKLEQLRKEYAGDLQLERQRFDDFVRDMLEKVIAPAMPATAAPARSSSSRERQLPSVVTTAIEDVCFGNLAMEQQQEREAWKRLKSDNSNAQEVADAIRKGEIPQ